MAGGVKAHKPVDGAEVATLALTKLLASAERRAGRASVQEEAAPEVTRGAVGVRETVQDSVQSSVQYSSPGQGGAMDLAPTAAQRPISLKFSASTFPAYLAMETHAEKIACHGALEVAAQAGAITIEWDRRAGERGQVLGLKLQSADKLALHLGHTPRWVLVDRARDQLEPWLDHHPVLAQVIDAWRRGVQVRGTGPGDVQQWLDALRALQACGVRQADRVDIFLRRLSSQLFKDTKRLEELSGQLDVLEAGELGSPPRSLEEIAGVLGLVHFPKEFSIAGEVLVRTEGREGVCGLPYSGYVAQAIEAFLPLDGYEPVRAVLTIENKTNFYEACRERVVGDGLVLVYTAGMPSPSWRAAYTSLLRAFPGARAMHYGDIDAGGFRIADLVAATAAQAGVQLELHQMDGSGVDHLRTIAHARKPLSAGEVNQILRICERRGWHQAGDWVREHPFAIEQEFGAFMTPRV